MKSLDVLPDEIVMLNARIIFGDPGIGLLSKQVQLSKYPLPGGGWQGLLCNTIAPSPIVKAFSDRFSDAPVPEGFCISDKDSSYRLKGVQIVNRGLAVASSDMILVESFFLYIRSIEPLLKSTPLLKEAHVKNP